MIARAKRRLQIEGGCYLSGFWTLRRGDLVEFDEGRIRFTPNGRAVRYRLSDKEGSALQYLDDSHPKAKEWYAEALPDYNLKGEEA